MCRSICVSDNLLVCPLCCNLFYGFGLNSMEYTFSRQYCAHRLRISILSLQLSVLKFFFSANTPFFEANPTYTVPTGFSSVPPVGPATPVVDTAISAPDSFSTPSAISSAHGILTSVYFSIVGRRTPSTLIFISFEYEQTPHSNTELEPDTLVIISDNRPPVQLSAVAIFRFPEISSLTSKSSIGCIFNIPLSVVIVLL